MYKKWLKLKVFPVLIRFCRCNHASEKTSAKPTWFVFFSEVFIARPIRTYSPYKGRKRAVNDCFHLTPDAHWSAFPLHFTSIIIQHWKDWHKVDWLLYSSPFCLMFWDLALLGVKPYTWHLQCQQKASPSSAPLHCYFVFSHRCSLSKSVQNRGQK